MSTLIVVISTDMPPPRQVTILPLAVILPRCPYTPHIGAVHYMGYTGVGIRSVYEPFLFPVGIRLLLSNGWLVSVDHRESHVHLHETSTSGVGRV